VFAASQVHICLVFGHALGRFTHAATEILADYYLLDWLQQARYLDRQRQFSWPTGTVASPMGQVFRPGKIHGKRENSQTGWWEHARHLPRPQPSRPHLQVVDADKLCSGAVDVEAGKQNACILWREIK
jgi:hypothetical protein